MRFLLQASKLPTKGIRPNVALPSSSAKSSTAFGQQCSPNCGCVLRFETALSDDGKVTHATYHAKTIVVGRTTSAETRTTINQPQYTMSSPSSKNNKKLMFVDCECKTLHTLAKQVVAQLPKKSMTTELRNQVEFTGTRSSLAFGHAVLQKYNQSPTQHQPCLDLVEDALTSMIRQGPMAPRRQRHASTFTQHVARHFQPLLEQAEEEEFVERYGRALRRIRKPRAMMGASSNPSMSAPASLSAALTMLDLQHDADVEVEPMVSLLPLGSAATATSKMDWETYVDELNVEQEEQQHTG